MKTRVDELGSIVLKASPDEPCEHCGLEFDHTAGLCAQWRMADALHDIAKSLEGLNTGGIYTIQKDI